MLADKFKIELKSALQQELQVLGQTVEELNKLLVPISPDNAIGRLSRMDAIEQQGVNQLKLNRQRHRQQLLEIALNRLANDNEFGLCDECGELITLKRLQLQPESRFCVKCQQQIDDCER